MDFDLEKRTVVFGKNVLNLCRTIPATKIYDPIANQLIRAATSVGANYYEANGASSREDFRSKIHLCKKEAKETTYWLTIMEECSKDKKLLCHLRQEAHELLLIFSKIASSSKR